MALHPLDGAFERVKRAEEHLAALRQMLDEVQLRHEQVVLTQLDLNNPLDQASGRVQVYMRVPILVGEICHNLRSALDYLVFKLAEYDAGAPQTDTQFPMVERPEDFRAQRAKRLKGINDLHVDMIERLQPYNGSHWTRALREISNQDKHRDFVNMRGKAAGMAYPKGPEYDSLALPIVRMRHPTGGEMDVKVDFSYTIHFVDGPPVMETLKVIKTKVLETLTEFKAEFR